MRLDFIFSPTSGLGGSRKGVPGRIRCAVLVLLLIALICAAAPWITPQPSGPESTIDLADAFIRPGETGSASQLYFALGADDQGRDMVSLLIQGSRRSLAIAGGAVLVSMLIGTTLGLWAGMSGPWIDKLIMRIADIQLTYPSLLVAMLFFGVARGSLGEQYADAMASYVLMLAIAASEWVQYARTVRSAVRIEREKDYVRAARLAGRSGWAIVTRHIFPNVTVPLMILAPISFSIAILTESTLSYLGVGLQGDQPSLGALIRIGQNFLFSGEWWIIFFPALILLLLTISTNLLGDWSRDELDPRSQ